MVQIEENVNYRLVNLEGGTYLTLDSKDNASVIGQECTGRSNQQFTFEACRRDNVYLLRSAENNQYISVPTGHIMEGQQLKARSAPFEWCVVDEPRTAIAARITPSENPSLYVDLYRASSKDGTPVQLYPKRGNNQVWVLLKEQQQ